MSDDPTVPDTPPTPEPDVVPAEPLDLEDRKSPPNADAADKGYDRKSSGLASKKK